jgi:hypothetical protein
MNLDRIQEIQEATAYPESRSVYTALHQVANEVGQEHSAQIAKLTAEVERLEGDKNKLAKAGKYLLLFIPSWAREVPKDLDATFYGTGSYEKDLVVKEAVEKAREVIDKAMESTGKH